jgi:ABC-type Na+ transport system ATPase subunit NatA
MQRSRCFVCMRFLFWTQGKTKYNVILSFDELNKLSEKQIESRVEEIALRLKSMFEEKREAPQE